MLQLSQRHYWPGLGECRSIAIVPNYPDIILVLLVRPKLDFTAIMM
jgi:hypothetical protein